MTVYASADVLTNAPVAVHGERKGVQMARATVNCTAPPSITDTFNFFYLPPGARVVGGYLSATDMDANLAPSLTFNIGDTGNPSRLFQGSVVGQAGTTTTAFAPGGLDYQYPVKTLVNGTVLNNAGNGVPGSLTLSLLYVVEE